MTKVKRLTRSYLNQKTHKYKAKKTVGLSNRRYDSKLEASVGGTLALMEKSSLIKILKAQHSIEFRFGGQKITRYIVDFVVQCLKSKEIYFVEAKGFETTDWRVKKNLWAAGGPGKLEIWKGDAYRPYIHETIFPKVYCGLVEENQVFGKF